MERLNYERRDFIFKFLVIGDYGVGKTAVVRRFTEGKFSSNYKITIGADFRIKTIQWDAKTRVNLQIWDIAGHERFGYMTRVYYKNAKGCAIVFDLGRYTSFQSVRKWLNDLHDKVVLDNGKLVPVVLLANKCDVEDACVPDEAISKLCDELGMIAWFKTSAKSNKNISESLNCLIDATINSNQEAASEPLPDVVMLHEYVEQSSSCCK